MPVKNLPECLNLAIGLRMIRLCVNMFNTNIRKKLFNQMNLFVFASCRKLNSVI